MADLSASVYNGIRTRSWPMTAPTSQMGMPTKLLGSSSATANPASAKQATMVSTCSGPAPYQRRKRRTSTRCGKRRRSTRGRMSTPEREAGDPFGVVHAGTGGQDHPGRVSVVRGKVGVVDPQGQQRVRVHDLP